MFHWQALDGWEGMKPGFLKACPASATPLARRCPQELRRLGRHLRAHSRRWGAPVRCGWDHLIYTWAPAGKPKGVMHSFGNFAWAIARASSAFPWVRKTACRPTQPLAHVVERRAGRAWLAAQWACSVLFADSLDAFALDLQRAQPTIFFSVPRLWVKFQQGIHHKMPPAKLNWLCRSR